MTSRFSWKRKRTATIAGLALAASAAGALIAFLAGRQKPVLQTAHLFCVVPPWSHRIPSPTYSLYYWLSNEELLVDPVGGDSRIGKFYRIRADPARNAGIWKAVQIAPPGADSADLTISPNGRLISYFLRNTPSPDSVPGRYLVVRPLGGAPLVKLHMHPAVDGWCAWSPDSGSLLTLECTPPADLTRIDIRNGSVRRMTLPLDLHAVNSRSTILGFTAKDRVLIARYGPGFARHSF